MTIPLGHSFTLCRAPLVREPKAEPANPKPNKSPSELPVVLPAPPAYRNRRTSFWQRLWSLLREAAADPLLARHQRAIFPAFTGGSGPAVPALS